MGLIRYSARRSLLDGITEFAQVDFQIPFTEWDESTNIVRTDTSADDGTTQSIIRRIETRYRVKAGPFYESNLPAVRMFRDSVSAGEAFQINPLGTDAGDLVSVSMQSRSLSFETLRTGAYMMSFEAEAV